METIAIVALVVLVLAGAPIWVSALTGATIMAVVALDMSPIILISVMYQKVAQTALIAVPLFIFSGQLLAVGGAAGPIVKVLNGFLGHVRGGPAYVIILACTIFGAMSSSATAAIAGFGPIMLPMMAQAGYSRRFSLGLLIGSVALAPLIPPSIPLIIFGYLTETSIRDLYVAGFIPGLLLAGLLAITVFIHSSRGHYTPVQKFTWGERWQAVKKGWPVMLMPVAVLVPIYGGWVTPSEGAVVAVIYSLILGFIAYRKLTLKNVWGAASTTVHVTSMLLLIMGAAFLLNLAFTYVRIPFKMNDALTSAGFGANTFLIVIIMAYLLMGMFLDPSAILMVSAPLLMPTILGLGISPILFGVVVVFSIEIACLTPPYGLVLFAAMAVLKESFGNIVRGLLMFYPALIVGQLMIAFIPQISLFLPNLLK
ncbi:TRAP transporter large permease [Chloroflexota bacterium]